MLNPWEHCYPECDPYDEFDGCLPDCEPEWECGPGDCGPELCLPDCPPNW